MINTKQTRKTRTVSRATLATLSFIILCLIAHLNIKAQNNNQPGLIEEGLLSFTNNYVGDIERIYDLPQGNQEVNEKPKDGRKEVKRITGVELDKVNSTVINFRKKKYELIDKHYATIDSVIDFMKEYQNIEMEIRGYTDSRLSNRKAEKISIERAKAVADYMNKKGIKRRRIIWRSFGKFNPIVSNSLPQGRVANNRVEFEVSGVIGGNLSISIKLETEETPYNEMTTKPKSAHKLYLEMLEMHGTVQIKNLIFKVQIGASPVNLSADHHVYSVAENVESKKYPDGLYRYTTGQYYYTLSIAEDHRKEMIQKGISDAFVLKYYNGERITIHELEKLLKGQNLLSSKPSDNHPERRLRSSLFTKLL